MNKKPKAPNFLKELDEEVGILTLVTGRSKDGCPYYAYALIPPSRYRAFKEAEKKGKYDLADYGKILTHGEGEPSVEIQKEMKEKYGANPKFENELDAVLKKGIKKILKRKRG